jgi:hypothetical protein
MTNCISKILEPDKIPYGKYHTGELSIKKCKQPELKAIAKYFKLHVTGTKPILIDRIELFFKKERAATQIQCAFRGHLIRFSVRLRGDAFKKRTICVNDTDFYTLDPLNEIEYDDFYSYKDSANFIYGFSIGSLITLFKNKGNITNPYNREKLSFKSMNEVFILYKLGKIFKSHEIPNFDKQSQCSQPTLNTISTLIEPANETSRNIIHNNVINNTIENDITNIQNINIQNMPIINNSQIINITNITNTIVNEPTVGVSEINNMNTNTNNDNGQNAATAVNINNSPSENMGFYITYYSDAATELITTVTEIQSKTIPERIRTLFMEIDQLGNYTSSTWFDQLDANKLMRLYRYLYDIWTYRGQISNEVKRRICSLQDPFISSHPSRINHIDYWRTHCLFVMEYMVYTGIDIEYQKIGALHVLSCLTLVSIDARNAMYWLYEGLVY